MSAPRTNIESQKRRHITPLMGMLAVVVFALILYVGWQFLLVGKATPPQGPAAVIDGRTGTVETATPPATDPVTPPVKVDPAAGNAPQADPTKP